MSVENLAKAVVITAEVMGHEMSKASARDMAMELSAYEPDQVAKALQRCKREMSGRLTLAAVIQRIDDGHLGAEEAWALCPTSEDETVVWTDEISQAYGVAAPLLEYDAVAARMAFKESYSRLLAAARAEKRMAHWWVSLGARDTRCPTIKRAVELGRMTAGDALRQVDESLPGYAALAAACGQPVKALPAPKPVMPAGPKVMASDIEALLCRLKGGAEEG